MMRRRGIVWIALFLCSALAGAEVKIGVRSDGTKLIYNEAPDQPAYRSLALRSLPRMGVEELILRHASRQRLDPRLVRAVVQVESGYNPLAVSHKGAMGLMQLMPETARLLEVRNPYDPEENLRGGTTYLRALMDRFQGRLELALAAYNAGPQAVEQYDGIPPYAETRSYVARVLELFHGRRVDVSQARRGLRPYLVRGPDNHLLLTTSASGGR